MSFLGNCCIGRKSFQALSASRSFSLQPEPADARPTAGINHVQCHNTQFYTRLTLSPGLIDHNQKITVAALPRAGTNKCTSISGCVETPSDFEPSEYVFDLMPFAIRCFLCGVATFRFVLWNTGKIPLDDFTITNTRKTKSNLSCRHPQVPTWVHIPISDGSRLTGLEPGLQGGLEV